MTLDAKIVAALSGVSTATLTTVLLKQGLRNVWMRGHEAAARRAAAPGRARLHAALRAGAGGSGDAGILVLAEIHPRRDRGDAGGLHRRGGRDGRHRRRHLRRHTVRADEASRRGRAGDRRRGARRGRRAGHRAAGVVPGRRGAALGRRADLRQLAGADRLRRRRGVAGRRRGGGPGRRGGDPAGAARTAWWSRRSSRSTWRPGSWPRSTTAPRCRACIRRTRRTRRATRRGGRRRGRQAARHSG